MNRFSDSNVSGCKLPKPTRKEILSPKIVHINICSVSNQVSFLVIIIVTIMIITTKTALN